MNKSIIEDAQHWRERAEEMRAVAEALSDAEAQRMMLGIAEGIRAAGAACPGPGGCENVTLACRARLA
jgi:hypothetical protein